MRWRWRAEVNARRLVSRLAVQCDKCSAHPLSSSSNSPSKPSTLLHLLFICSSFHPLHHPSLPWLAGVSCSEAVNNSSRWVVLPSPAPHFWLAVALKNIWRRARCPHTWVHQRMQSITCAALSIAQHMHVCRTVCNSVEVKYKM